MALSIGIVGLPNAGKSTLFNTLTKHSVPAENYPFCTIDPSVGVTMVPDKRLDVLGDLSKSKKIIQANVSFVDIAGLVKGASVGEGLGNEFLSHIRETDAIAQVVRVFKDPEVIHVEGDVSPVRDLEIIRTELSIADLYAIEKHLAKLEKRVRNADKEAIHEKKVLTLAVEHLKDEKHLKDEFSDSEDLNILHSLGLLSIKPILYVLNIGAFESSAVSDNAVYKEISEYLTKNKMDWIVLDAKTECDIKDDKESDSIRKSLGLDSFGVDLFIQKAYTLLGLITFLTTGEEETRAWTIKKGTNAKDAGTAIHEDFKDKFKRAEVIDYKVLVEKGSYANARESGAIRTEGREYIVKDGDVIVFKI